MSHIAGLTHALMALASGLAVAATLYVGVETVSAGALEGPHLALLVLAVMAGFEALAPLSHAYQYWGQTRKAAARLNRVIQMPPSVRFPDASQRRPADGRLAFNRLCFQYARSDRPALENISFNLRSGERLAIAGPTGAGKSTLLYLLARFEDPSSGTIRMGRCNLDALSERDLRQHLCIVDQGAHIFNGTLRDNLLLADPHADNAALLDALSTVQLKAFVEALPDGLETWVGEAGRLLSGGQRRRLAIARAVIKDAPIWILDEPTEGLDAETAKAMMSELLARTQGKTFIMVSHHQEAIEPMDKVLLLNEGRIEALDSPGALKQNSALYRRLINA